MNVSGVGCKGTMAVLQFWKQSSKYISRMVVRGGERNWIKCEPTFKKNTFLYKKFCSVAKENISMLLFNHTNILT